MRFIKKLIFFFSLFLVYIILKEFIGLYHFTRSVHPYFGYGTLVVIAAFIVYFIIVPIVQIIRIPRSVGPTRNPQKIPDIIRKRMKNFKRNPALSKRGYNFQDLPDNEDGYNQILKALEPEAEKIRKKYVVQLFYSSSIAQNGFLDAILILSSSVNLVKELFLLYQGRVSNRDLMGIARRVYYSMAIGGSEGVEYATEEILSKLTSGGVKSIPFASKILGSIADGFVNAVLLNRISIITENICKFLFIASDSDLYPSVKSVVSSTRIITADLIDKIFSEIKAIAKEKTSRVVLMTVNPVGYLLGSAMNRMADGSGRLSPQQRAIVRESAAIAQNPFGYGFRKFSEIFKKKTFEDDDIFVSPLA